MAWERNTESSAGFESITLHYGGLAWDQAALPILAGGLGIRDPLTSWSEALMTFQRNASASVAVPEEIRLHPASDIPKVL